VLIQSSPSWNSGARTYAIGSLPAAQSSDLVRETRHHLERVAHEISLTGSALAFEGTAASGESCRGALYFQVIDPARADGIIETVDALLRERALSRLADADLPADPTECRRWLKQALNADVRERGLLVTRVDLQRGEPGQA